MKILLYISLAVCAIFICPLETYGQNDAWSDLLVKDALAKLERDQVTVKFDVVLNNYLLPSNGQLVLTPVIMDGKGNEAALPEMIVNGRRRDNIYRRMLRLRKGDTSPYRVVRVQSRRAKGSIGYNSQIAFERWMNGASVYLQIDLCGCGNESIDITGIKIINKITSPKAPVFDFAYKPYVSFVHPPKEETKKREEVGSAYIIYHTGQSVIRPELFSNSAELSKIAASISYVKEEPQARIMSITIDAFSSPEGSFQSNLALSKRRAESLREYIARQFGMSPNLIRATGRGEDWEGLAKLLETDYGIEERMEALRIIREVDVFSGREKLLMDLAGGRAYRYMLEKLFPRLRRSDYRVEYTIPEFTIERGKELLATRPGLLSAEELYIIANTYEKGSDDFLKVLDVAASQYPENAEARLNAAAVCLLRGETEKADEILSGYTDNPQAWNNLGVLMMGRRRLDEAENYLNRARTAGVEEAAHNLDLLEELKDAVVEFDSARDEYDQYRQKSPRPEPLESDPSSAPAQRQTRSRSRSR
ncbi:MAG: DUF3868 domain-containing protein [Proteiniphilum sp.]|nr:DUF3868 domain-containing protein [Proteiniphilum sp.]